MGAKAQKFYDMFFLNSLVFFELKHVDLYLKNLNWLQILVRLLLLCKGTKFRHFNYNNIIANSPKLSNNLISFSFAKNVFNWKRSKKVKQLVIFADTNFGSEQASQFFLYHHFGKWLLTKKIQLFFGTNIQFCSIVFWLI